MSLERRLEELQSEAPAYPARYRQLAAVRYYLQQMLQQCERYWMDDARGITNYKTLLDEVERFRKPDEHVGIVTFNYDRMIERALPTVGLTIETLGDYVANSNYKLIKLHGSTDWGRKVSTAIESASGGHVWRVVSEMIERAAELSITDDFTIVTTQPVALDGETPVFPAIAIPVESKQEYQCPPAHVDALRAFLPEVTKMLVIGWRASEIPFRKLLKDTIQHPLRVMVVGGSVGDNEESIDRLRKAGLDGEFTGYAGGGFTDLVVGREAQQLLRV